MVEVEWKYPLKELCAVQWSSSEFPQCPGQSVHVPVTVAEGLESLRASSGSGQPRMLQCPAGGTPLVSPGGDSGWEGQEAEVRAPEEKGHRLSGNWGTGWAPATCFRLHRPGAPGSPSKALNQLSLPSFVPILGLTKVLTLQRQWAFFLEALTWVSGFKFSFLLQENFP